MQLNTQLNANRERKNKRKFQHRPASAACTLCCCFCCCWQQTCVGSCQFSRLQPLPGEPQPFITQKREKKSMIHTYSPLPSWQQSSVKLFKKLVKVRSFSLGNDFIFMATTWCGLRSWLDAVWGLGEIATVLMNLCLVGSFFFYIFCLLQNKWLLKYIHTHT